eukprot:jgi/Botrbrau1/17770/Bobra.0127s0025.1
MEYYPDNSSPTEDLPGGIWRIFPNNRSKKYKSMPAINNYYQSLLDVQPRPPRAVTIPRLHQPTKSVVQLLDSAWWGVHGLPEEDEHDSGTPSSQGSAGSFEPDFQYSYADLRALDRNRAQQAGPSRQEPQQSQRIPRPPLQRSFRRHNSKRFDSRDGSRQSSVSHSVAGAAASTHEGEGPSASTRGSAGLLRRLGTWAERVTLFVRSAPSEHSYLDQSLGPENAGRERDGEDGGGEGEDGGTTTPSSSLPPIARRSVRIAEPEEKPEPPPEEEEIDLEMVKKAAWKYRFTRRWQQEQAKQLDPDFGREGGDEEWDEALGYLKGVGTTIPQAAQILMRSNSDMDDRSGVFSNAPSLNTNLLLMPDSVRDKGRGKAAPEATKALAEVARRAQDLAQKQAQINQTIEDRWERAAEGKGYLDDIEMVEIDTGGRFPFVLAYLTRGKEAGRFLVRGHARTSPADLLQSIQFEVASSQAGKVQPGLQVIHLGTGTLQWNSNRILEVVEAHHTGARHPRVRDAEDVARHAGTVLTSCLRKCRIIVDGARLS